MKIKDEELKQINGGVIKWGLGIAIAAGVTFIIGLVDGYVRPLACNK
jgi:lactobin A/cerein 7B family class IIb bacteriocin